MPRPRRRARARNRRSTPSACRTSCAHRIGQRDRAGDGSAAPGLLLRGLRRAALGGGGAGAGRRALGLLGALALGGLRGLGGAAARGRAAALRGLGGLGLGGLGGRRGGRGGGRDRRGRGERLVAGDGAEVGRVRRAPGRVGGGAERDAEADLGELAGEDVVAVARAVHPRDRDVARGGEVALAPRDVLADRPVAVGGDVAAGREAVDERAAVRGDVREEARRDHAGRVGGAGLGEALRLGDGVKAGGGALVVEQAQGRLARLGDRGGGRHGVRAGAGGVLGRRVSARGGGERGGGGGEEGDGATAGEHGALSSGATPSLLQPRPQLWTAVRRTDVQPAAIASKSANARFRSAAASRRVRSRIASPSTPWAASVALPPLTHPSTIAGVTSGWNCRPTLRPSANPCGHTAVRASSRAPGGSVNVSWCHENHGPGAIARPSSGSISSHPISGVGARRTSPPSAAASAWPPKQRPRTGTSCACASRRKSICGAIHSSFEAWTECSAPSGAIASNRAGSGHGPAPSSGARSVTTRWPRAAAHSPSRPAGASACCSTTARSISPPPGTRRA